MHCGDHIWAPDHRGRLSELNEASPAFLFSPKGWRPTIDNILRIWSAPKSDMVWECEDSSPSLEDAYRLAKRLYCEMMEEAIYLAAEKIEMCEVDGDIDGMRYWNMVGEFVFYLHTGKVANDWTKFGT